MGDGLGGGESCCSKMALMMSCFNGSAVQLQYNWT